MLILLGIAARILTATAFASLINARIFKLPVAVGLLVVGLITGLSIHAINYFQPQLGAADLFILAMKRVDYPKLVLEFLLAYLLFAGAMNVNLRALFRRGVAVTILATLGTVITAVLVAAGFWAVAQALGFDLPPAWALVFGVLISPTDPIAVLAMTKRTSLEPNLQAQIEGEALFNDGVAVVLFRAALAFALAMGAGAVDTNELALGVLEEALGGAGLGLVCAIIAVLIMRVVDDWATELLITLALATGVYAGALELHLSGPIGVVVAGLVIGSDWSERGMSEKTKEFIHPFWHMADEAMNAVLFFMAGLMVFFFAHPKTPKPQE